MKLQTTTLNEGAQTIKEYLAQKPTRRRKPKKERAENFFKKGLVHPTALKPGMIVCVTSTATGYKAPSGNQSLFKVLKVYGSSMRCELFGETETRRVQNHDGTYTILFYNSRIYKH